MGNTQDAGMPHIGCKHKFCLDNFSKYEEFYVTSIAVINSDLNKYILFEATPDITYQLNHIKNKVFQEFLLPEAIYITHAHIGHYSGLMYFGREALGSKNLLVKVLPKMSNFLKTNGPWSQLVDINNIKIQNLSFGSKTNELRNITVTPIQVPHRDEYSETSGFIIEGRNKKALFIPDIDKWEKWDQDISKVIQHTDFALIDGTFYNGLELDRDMSEIPHPSVEETLELFLNQPVIERNKIYFIHINHTNPILTNKNGVKDLIESYGFNVAKRGLKFNL